MWRVADRLTPLAIFCILGCVATVCAQNNAEPDQHTLELLRKITLAEATAGDEANVRAVIRAELGNTVSLVETSRGDLVAKLPGKPGNPVILLSAHMDEVGFQVRSITPDGFLTLAPLGDWYAGSMSDHRVTVQTARGSIPGVVGVPPPHLMTPEEKTRAPAVADLYVDIGASSADQARQWGVQQGDRIAPRGSFFRLGQSNRYASKSWDDRAGCALLLQVAEELRNRNHPNTIDLAWTTSEEFGRSNATVELPGPEPDFVIVAEVGITTDTPDTPSGERQEKLGGGPVLDLYDGSLSTPPGIRDWFAERARAAAIPLQYTTLMQQGAGVGTENSSFLFRAPSTALLVPLRYAHAPQGIIDIEDYLRTRELLTQVLLSLDTRALRQMAGEEQAPR